MVEVWYKTASFYHKLSTSIAGIELRGMKVSTTNLIFILVLARVSDVRSDFPHFLPFLLFALDIT